MHGSLKRCIWFGNSMLKRQFFRQKSYYLSEKWTKEPFDIGYPVNTGEVQDDSRLIRAKLFPNKGLTEYEYFIRDSGREFEIDQWNQLDSDQLYKYQKIVDDNKPQYVHPKPEFATGFELFKLELQLNKIERKYWLVLDNKNKERYNNSEVVEKLYNERLRIWQGYEIVEYLKRYLQKYMFNPYPLLGLYPWEIIKDKLRLKGSIQDFEKDYYDTLINETFGRNSQRRALQIYYTDIRYELKNENFHYAKVEKLFNDLPSHRKQYYFEKEHKRQEHAKRTRFHPYKQSTPYLRFFVQFNKTYEPSNEELNTLDSKVSDKNIHKLVTIRAASREWKKLTDRQKKYYENDNTISSNTRLYKEIILDWKVEMVMDYIYKVGGVSGMQKSYEWRKDMHAKSNGYRYLKKMYVNRLVYLQKGNLIITDD